MAGGGQSRGNEGFPSELTGQGPFLTPAQAVVCDLRCSDVVNSPTESLGACTIGEMGRGVRVHLSAVGAGGGGAYSDGAVREKIWLASMFCPQVFDATFSLEKEWEGSAI